jgi:hypothetical protein
MNTKIVYVVSSNKDDYYLEQAYLSVFSLRKHNPQAHVCLIMDTKTNASLNGRRTEILNYVDDKIVVEVPSLYNKAQTSRWMKTKVRDFVKGDYLFLDCDTIIADDLSAIDDFEGEIGAVVNIHVPISQYYNKYGDNIVKIAAQEGWLLNDDIKYYNSGVMFFRHSERVYHFCSEWHRTWEEGLLKYKRRQDQPSLANVNEKFGYLIKELPGIWNCQILRYGIPYLANAKIIHYFSYHIMDKNDKLPYAFYNLDVCSFIRDHGFISDDIVNMIEHPKDAFVNPTRLCSYKELILLSGSMAQVCLHHPRLLSFMNSCCKTFLLMVKTVKRWVH